jgi:periplasmic protein TonB
MSARLPQLPKLSALPALPASVANPLRRTGSALNSGYLRLGKTHLQRMLVLSVVIHALVLLVRFVPDDVLKRWDKQALLVVLVNSNSDETPLDAQALANANLRGGGEEDAGLVKSPLPNMGASQDGDELSFLQKQVTALEKEQASLLSMIKGQSLTQATSGTAQQYNPLVGTAAMASNTPMMREVAVLDKQVQDYNKRPKRKFISPATREAAFANYFAQWSDRTERLGTEYYPDAARGKFAEVIVTVSVRSDGTIEDIVLEKSSGNKAIDRGALRLLKRLAPYPPFKDTMKQAVDVLDITTKLVFTPADTLTAETMISPNAASANGANPIGVPVATSASAAPRPPTPAQASPVKQ